MNPAAIKFKYHPVNAKGQSAGFLATKGEFDGEHLVVGKERIPANAIIKCVADAKRLAVFLGGNHGPIRFDMNITGGSTAKLSQAINMIASVYQTQAHREALEKAGNVHAFRVEACPSCRCMIDLTHMPAAPQVYCPFCDHIATLQNPPPDEKAFSTCSACGLYSQPRVFTIGYFWFLGVVHGYSYRRRYICNACARGEAWKMFFGNLIFVLFVPMAIVQLFRAYAGGSARSVTFRGLDNANALQKKRKYSAAINAYERIESHLPSHAGILYNHAIALQRDNRVDDAFDFYERSAAACPNFPPTARELIPLYDKRNLPEQSARLKAFWNQEPSPANS
jgi:tetratricopeptide (TPR) repeat protein